MTHNIAVIGGDGIGPEVTAEAIKVVRAAGVDITTTDFERVPETIPLGEKAAREMAAKLVPLAVPEAQYDTWRANVTAGQNIETRLADVQYKGMERVNPEYLKQRAQVQPGDTVDTAEISAEAQRMSALQDFESVEYRLTGDPASPTLEWWPLEKRWGPDYLKFDLGLYAPLTSDTIDITIESEMRQKK